MMLPSIFGENLFDDLMDLSLDRDFFGGKNPLYKQETNLMKTDFKENEDNYEVDIDLPGFSKDEISAHLKDGYLTVSASKDVNNDEKDENGKYIRKERYSGSCSRSFYIGTEIKEDEIKAKYENGILKLNVPKKDQKQVEEKKTIAIEG